ncbi:MAG: DUF4292 domain-containing protein [Saprospiraceae bacterium]|nr:DUF4292 domain-containing protein [Saprospiraceae bacterium]
MNKSTSITAPGMLACLAFLSILLFATSCASSKKTAVKKPKAGKITAEYLSQHMVENQVKANWLSAKAKVGYQDDYVSVNGSATLAIRKDSLIWMSVRKLGFEVARVQITPDSVYVIDRLSNEYSVKSLQSLADSYQLPANFSALQALLLGNPIFFSRKPLKMIAQTEYYLLENRSDNIFSQYQIGVEGLNIRGMQFDDFNENRRIDLQYESYERIPGGQNFSYLRNLKFDSQDTGQLNIAIKFTEVELDTPRQIRFEIPDRYQRVE